MTAFAILILFLSATVPALSENECVYTLYVQTGSVIKAGTDASISVTLSDSRGGPVWIPNLRGWGLMGPDHDYFERGNVDIFTGRGPCISTPICRLNVTSDGSGHHHGWYCDYIQLTSTGPHKACSQSRFFVDQWLAYDAPPYQLTAIVDDCRRDMAHSKRPLVVNHHKLKYIRM